MIGKLGTGSKGRKYSFVNRTIQLLNQLPADALGTFPCKPSIFRKRVRKVISEVKQREAKRAVP
jgi:hypothetical protein